MNKKIMFKTLFLAAFGMQLHAQDYCEPEWSGWAVNEPTEPISLVQFGVEENADGAINNPTSALVSTDTPRYEDFSSTVVTVNKGETYTLKVKGNTDGNNTDYITVYFDWNGDGVFSNSTPATIEEQQQWTNQKEKHQHGMSLINSAGEDDVEVSYTVNIPTDAVTGEIRMRVVKNYNAPSPAPCSNPFIFGQVEDYTLNISEGTCYPVFEYNADGEMITQVIFNTIDNTSPFQSGTTPQYEDFTDISTEVQAGSDYELSVKGPASTFPSDVVAYIDFNQDGVFDQDTEFFYVGRLAAANPANANPVTTTITIPETALNGETIMRIIKNSNVAAYSDDEAPNTIVDACAEDLRSGQVEEYIVNILEATESEYCIPDFFYPSSSAGVILNQISLTGETITWNIDAITYDENGYADYTDEPSADLLPGSAYDLNFHTDWQDPHFINVRAWVDYNQNGQFDDEEEIGYINSGMASSGEGAFNFTVPENTPVGIYRLRVIMQFPNSAPNNLTPCGTIDSYGVGIDYNLQVIDAENPTVCAEPGLTPGDTGCVTFTYAGETVTYTTVRGADGNIWLQQNLGSESVGTSATDALAFGDLFQWGRWDDGHQSRMSDVSNVLLSPNNPTALGLNNSNFYLTDPEWWSSGNVNDTWNASTPQDVSETDGCDPCKAALGEGWEVPTQAEWQTIIAAEEMDDIQSAYDSNLKLVVAGARSTSGVYHDGLRGYYWSKTISETNPLSAKNLYYSDFIVNPESGYNKEQGMSVRCIYKQNQQQELVVMVTTQDSVPAEITTENGTLQLIATITPSEANQAVTWSVEEGYDYAAVSEEGLVSITGNGVLIVRATSVENEDIFGEIQITVNVEDEDGYCTAGVSYDVEPITLVDFSDLNNPTSAAVNGTPAYEDFTSIIVNVEQGETYTLTVKGNTNGDFEHDIRVFIDWNNDTEFDMSTEYYTASLLPSTGEDNVEVSIEIVVPTDAVLGETRMRVTKDMWNVYEEGDFDACTNAYYGQIEDYTINISEPIEECTPITDLYEDFDDYSCCEMGVVPTCWDSIILGGASQIISSTEPASGTSQIYQFGFGEDKISIVVLPQFSNVNAGTHQFRFKVKASSGPGELEFGYITDIADASTFVVIEELTISNSSYDSVDAERIIAVPTSVPSTARLAVRNPGTTWAGIYWDDVYWEPISQNSIESVEVTTQDNIPAEITTENGTLQLVATVTPSDVSQAVTWSVEEGTEFVSVDENGLVTAIANGTATVRATSVEDETKYGEIEVVVNISEEPVDPDCEVIETFDVTFDDFENFPENCWSSNDSSEYTFTVLEEDSNKMLQVYSGFAEEEVYIISPEMVSIDGLHSVSYEVISISEPGTTLQVGTMSDPSDVSTFVAAEDAVDTSVGVYTSQLVSSVEGHKYVAIKYVHNGGHKVLKLDNIKWVVPASSGKFDRSQVTLYPNPTRNLIYIDTDLNLQTIDVYNNLGQRILTTNGADNSVDLSAQPAGVYIFRLQTVDGQTAEYKVIKQ